MKKIFFYICLIPILCILQSCNTYQNKNVNQSQKIKDTLTKQNLNKISPLSLEALQGIWADTENENALFYIKNDSLYYTEDQDNPISIKLLGDTLLIMGDVPVRCKILKLTDDSLWYKDEFNDTPTKLYKR